MKREMERKALLILEDDDRIKHLGKGIFIVGGDSKKVYTVNAVAKTCDCPSFNFKGMCKHEIAVRVYVRRKREAEDLKKSEGFMKKYSEYRDGHGERLRADTERRLADRREKEAI